MKIKDDGFNIDCDHMYIKVQRVSLDLSFKSAKMNAHLIIIMGFFIYGGNSTIYD